MGSLSVAITCTSGDHLISLERLIAHVASQVIFLVATCACIRAPEGWLKTEKLS